MYLFIKILSTGELELVHNYLNLINYAVIYGANLTLMLTSTILYLSMKQPSGFPNFRFIKSDKKDQHRKHNVLAIKSI
jgi:hypothetical protein